MRKKTEFEKILPLKELGKKTPRWKKRGRKIVLCHGCFDLLHPGHVKYLQAAKAMGDVLIVTLTPDRFVDKGFGRPVFSEQLRAENLAALQCVDYVSINEWPTAENTLRLLKPDFYVKGQEFEKLQDPTGKIQREYEVIKEIGAELKFTHEIVFSSTKLIHSSLQKPDDTDEFRIDGHKLNFHPFRVGQWSDACNDWEKAKSVYPIYVEISPYGACNHRCVFCALDFVGYKPQQLNPEILRERLSEMAVLGVKSVMFAGEGEPTLWPHLPMVLDHCSTVHIDSAVTTNLVPVDDRNAESMIRNCTWIKVSINAGTKENYSIIHQTRESDFETVLRNFELCLSIRRKNQYRCTIGAQMILLPENAGEAIQLGKILRDLGVDYFVIKPYSQHRFSNNRKYEGINYESMLEIEGELNKLNSSSFKIIFRRKTMLKLQNQSREYSCCSATPFFWAYIMAEGSIYGCSAFIGEDRFRFGNINQSSFRKIWEGERRKSCFSLMKTLDLSECRQNCRMDEVNRYLWTLRHPIDHVNFI